MSCPGSQRDYSSDNIRFFLIVCVVFGHLLEVSGDLGGWNKGLYRLIYSFHMPAFLFLFGYFAKYSPKRILFRWLFPYVILQTLYLLFTRYVLHKEVFFQYTTPYWLLWYSLVCIYYQLLIPVYDVPQRYLQAALLLASVAIALLIGYVDDIGYPFSLSRFFVFQPWFLFGFYSSKNNLPPPEQNSHCLTYRIGSILLIAAWLFCIVYSLSFSVPNGLLYGSKPYSEIGCGVWSRCVCMIISLIWILVLFFLIKPFLNKKWGIITQIGQNTLPVYLLHGFVVKLIGAFFPTFLTNIWQVVSLTCLLVVLLGNRCTSRFVSLVSFSWLEQRKPR